MFPPPFRHWMRHMAMVPKGFLRYQVLKLLSEKPMSGSEIMSEIEKQTNGHWKPSPGSIYPLLAWLQDKGYIKEVPEQEAGTKRYTLTEQGKNFLEEHEKRREELRRRFRHFGLHWTYVVRVLPRKSQRTEESHKRTRYSGLETPRQTQRRILRKGSGRGEESLRRGSQKNRRHNKEAAGVRAPIDKRRCNS